MGSGENETGAARKAVVIEVSRAVLGLLAAGLLAAMTILWNTPTDFARRDGQIELLKERHNGEIGVLKQRVDSVVDATKEIPVLKQDLGIIKYRVDELKTGQAQTIDKLDAILKNQRTVGGTQ